ncbi:MAG: family 20 glycosylhydrolase, partial [Firmicutes bacterium]|nr:family 20 glycosylhydrolase [Bacillota bacterium]
MKHKFKQVLSLALALCMVLSLASVNVFATTTGTAESTAADTTEDTASSTSYAYSIVHLDNGRKYYSVDSIKTIIDNAAAAGFNYIELAVGNDGLRFLLDDMSLSFTVNGTEYSYTSEQVSSAIHTGNEAYYNETTDELTQDEMDEIIAYAKTKGMGVIPCVNTPGHMDAILYAGEALTGETLSYYKSGRTIDVTNDLAVAFTQALLQKYISYFADAGCTVFNMGADEYANDVYTSGSMGFGALQSAGQYSYYVEYVNEVAALVKEAGMTPMAFNDGIYFNNVTSSGTFDTDIMIAYWSSGWSGYTVASASTLANMGFKMINTHGDYYWVVGNSTWQCSADKAAGFDYTSFQGGTISDPA